jgi:arylsulfatase A-like enzyme
VVFTSDHGEELLDHGGTEHAKTLYQELLRIPLAVRLPRATHGGTREAAPVQQIDLLPTLLGLAGVAPPPGLPGRNLAQRWLGSPDPSPEPPLLFADERFTVISKAAVRAGPLKLILNSDGVALWRAGTQLELHDLANDPRAAEHRGAVAHPRGLPAPGARALPQIVRFRAQRPRLALTPGELDQLRAPGYVHSACAAAVANREAPAPMVTPCPSK